MAGLQAHIVLILIANFSAIHYERHAIRCARHVAAVGHGVQDDPPFISLSEARVLDNEVHALRSAFAAILGIGMPHESEERNACSKCPEH